jgi:hypothetical protein
MSNHLILKTQIRGARRIKFERILSSRDETISTVLREMIDYYIEHQSSKEGSNTMPSK